MTTTLVAEIGSTTTVVNAFTGLDGKDPKFIAQGFAPTSVGVGDVLIGLNQALAQLKHSLGEEPIYDNFFATSSAAGGLKMTVHGLVYDMTVKAAREAALGAGAVLRYATAGQISGHDLEQIRSIRPNIILLAGGVDYGDKEVVLENAKKLSRGIKEMQLKVPVIYAGNIAAAEEVKYIFEGTGTEVYVVENVYPSIDQLNVEPTRKVIQQVFEEHITQAPGMARIKEMVQGRIMPTPGAVMQAAKCMYEEMGDLLVVDVGGATTDIHSVTEGSEEINRILLSPEPIAKRTVEGDLGVYVNGAQIMDLIGREDLEARYGTDYQALLKPVPESVEEIALSRELTAKAVEVALRRHAGKLINIFGTVGRTTLAQGKDLTRVKWIIGTGGALTRLPGGMDILGAMTSDLQKELLPRPGAALLLDHYYILSSLGVLCGAHREGAFYLMRESMGIES
jgi:uncharacterized protein (TIGR01319 family)